VQCWGGSVIASGVVAGDETADESVGDEIACPIGASQVDEVSTDVGHELVGCDGFAIGNNGREDVLKGVGVDVIL